MKYFVISIIFYMGMSVIHASNKKINPKTYGLKIANIIEKANDGYLGETADMKMVLIDAYGSKSVRLIRGLVKEIKGDGDKSLSIFLNPKDVKGTKMLTWSHKVKDDDQWLYLPSIRRVKRISSRNKSASFMGSEFSYEDIGSQELEKYHHKWLRDEKYKKHSTWILERIPKSKSGYSRQVSWISKKLNSPLKINYYDRKGELLKVAYFSKFKSFKINGKNMYRAGKIHMKNIQTKKESIFTWENRKLGVKQKDRVFKKQSLK